MIDGALVQVHLMVGPMRPQTHFKVISLVPKGKRDIYYLAKSPYWQPDPWREGDYDGIGLIEVPGTISNMVSQTQYHIPAGFAEIGAAIQIELWKGG